MGGYHGAKQRRYQDLITHYLNPEIRQFGTIFKNVSTEDDLAEAMQQQQTLNLLNTKYIIFDPNSAPLENPCAFGNAWTVDSIVWVATPNEEFDQLRKHDLQHTAVLHQEFKDQLGSYTPSSEAQATVKLLDYKPNQLTYSVNADQDRLVVFSEIWTGKGWTLRLDGKEHPLLRADYLLRATLIPSGQHEIVMRYEPRIWRVGNTIALVSSLLILIGAVCAIVLSFKKTSGQPS